MDVYGIIFIYELLNYYAIMLGIDFSSISIETRTDKGIRFNTLDWNDIDKYIDDLLKGYNLQYQKLVRAIVKEKKYIISDEAEALIKKCLPFSKEAGFFNLWLGEIGTAAERAIVQPLPWVTINHIIRITGCNAKMTSSVDSYEYNLKAYTNKLSNSKNETDAEDTEYKYIMSRIVNEKVTTLTYNQLAKNECPQEINALFKKINKMLDKLRKISSHEFVNGISVKDFLSELSKYIRQSSPYLKYWRQAYEPYDISNKTDLSRVDPMTDAIRIINETYA